MEHRRNSIWVPVATFMFRVIGADLHSVARKFIRLLLQASTSCEAKGIRKTLAEGL